MTPMIWISIHIRQLILHKRFRREPYTIANLFIGIIGSEILMEIH